MCVWSAYTGKRFAAAEAWESLKKIEGIWSGFYTGLVTCSEGKLHMGKVMGNMEVWSGKFCLDDFPGNSALIHSRTNSDGDERWGHPFVGTSGKVAIIAQGAYGVFSDRANLKFEEWGNEMIKNGKRFVSGIRNDSHRYPMLPDGNQVHCTEVIGQSVEYWYEKLGNPLKAIKHVLSEIATEAAYLFLFSDRPGIIGFANANQHMVYQQSSDGVYLSITALGLPGNCGMELPCNCAGIISPDELHIEKLHNRYNTMMELPSGLLEASYEFIKATPGCLLGHVVDKVLRSRFPAGTLNYRCGAAYRILETLVLDGKVKLVPTPATGLMGAPGTSFRLYAV